MISLNKFQRISAGITKRHGARVVRDERGYGNAYTQDMLEENPQ